MNDIDLKVQEYLERATSIQESMLSNEQDEFLANVKYQHWDYAIASIAKMIQLEEHNTKKKRVSKPKEKRKENELYFDHNKGDGGEWVNLDHHYLNELALKHKLGYNEVAKKLEELGGYLSANNKKYSNYKAFINNCFLKNK